MLTLDPLTTSRGSDTRRSVINAKGWKQARWIKIDLFNVRDRREARARGQFVLKRLHARGRTFRENLNAPVIKVLHITDNLMPRGRALSEETIPHALHVAANEKSARNFIVHSAYSLSHWEREYCL